MKVVKAVAPFVHPEYLNFKTAPYEAWVKMGGQVVKPLYPPKSVLGLIYRIDMPTYPFHKNLAILCFVEPISLYLDTFPYSLTYEIIPVIWDCWPRYYDKMEKWLKRHNVRTAIFTSSIELFEIKKRCPHIHMLHCPEAIDVSLYKKGGDLTKRTIDLLEFGRSNKHYVSLDTSGLKHVCTQIGKKFIYNNEQLYEAMSDSKITICLPKNYTHPEIAQNVETLTQRYWEAMLSRILIVGHCPKELLDILGYNPLIEIEDIAKYGGLMGIRRNISDFQELVNKNRQKALELGSWNSRIVTIKKWLKLVGYII